MKIPSHAALTTLCSSLSHEPNTSMQCPAPKVATADSFWNFNMMVVFKVLLATMAAVMYRTWKRLENLVAMLREYGRGLDLADSEAHHHKISPIGTGRVIASSNGRSNTGNGAGPVRTSCHPDTQNKQKQKRAACGPNIPPMQSQSHRSGIPNTSHGILCRGSVPAMTIKNWHSYTGGRYMTSLTFNVILEPVFGFCVQAALSIIDRWLPILQISWLAQHFPQAACKFLITFLIITYFKCCAKQNDPQLKMLRWPHESNHNVLENGHRATTPAHFVHKIHRGGGTPWTPSLNTGVVHLKHPWWLNTLNTHRCGSPQSTRGVVHLKHRCGSS